MRSIKLDLFLVIFILCISFIGFADKTFAAGTLSASSCGGNSCQNLINNALTSGGVVHLSAGTYTIDNSIHMHSGNTLEGDSGAKIFLVSGAHWPKDRAMIDGSSVTGVRITGFEIDGNRANNNDLSGKCGQYLYTMLYFTGSSNLEVDHMYMHHNWNDILKVSDSNNIKFHDNNVRQPGHDVVYAIKCRDVAAYNNYIRIYCNSGIRSDGSKNVFIYNNDIARDDGAGGNAGIELQNEGTVWDCNNNIHNTARVIDFEIGGSMPFSGTIKYDGCPTSGAPDFPPGDGGGGGGTGTTCTSWTYSDWGACTNGTQTRTVESSSPSGCTGGSPVTSQGCSAYVYDPSTPFSPVGPPTPTNPATPSAPTVVSPIFPNPVPGPYDKDCITGDAAKNTAGFIPCGKKFNDPATKWNECESCGLCSVFLMGQLSIEFMMKVAAVAASLAIIFAGFIYIFAAGRSDMVSKSKSTIKYTLLGFMIIFVAWLSINTLLTTLGYIDPVGGSWYTIC
jgi:hypothetical protein